MWLIIALLSIWGLLAVYSSTGALAHQKQGGKAEVYLIQQFAFLLTGFLIMLVTHAIHYKYYLRFSKIFLFVSYFLLVLTIFMGASYNDAQRWLKIPLIGITFQSSDVARVALILYVARELALRQLDIKDFKKGFLPIILHVGFTCLLIAPSNLSTALVLFSTCMVIMFMGRVSIKHIFYVGGPSILVIGLGLLLALNTPDKYLAKFGRVVTWKHRIENFNKPSDNPGCNLPKLRCKICHSQWRTHRCWSGRQYRKKLFTPSIFRFYLRHYCRRIWLYRRFGYDVFIPHIYVSSLSNYI